MIADGSETGNFEENTEESQKNPDGSKHETQEEKKQKKPSWIFQDFEREIKGERASMHLLASGGRGRGGREREKQIPP